MEASSDVDVIQETLIIYKKMEKITIKYLQNITNMVKLLYIKAIIDTYFGGF